ncbi:MAG: NADH-dependent flavin oxidoreductase [Candidatus Izimaplasma sp.]|nr:NADH-dependent flavin oxidoreductase [Candidatus Izimaplasma bacterium]
MEKAYDTYTFNSGLRVKNRFSLAPMTTYSSNDDLTLSAEEERYFKARSGQFGMIISPAVAVNKNGQGFSHQISICSDQYNDSLKRLSSAIKTDGSKAIIQLYHGGRMAVPNLFDGQRILAPSAVKALRDYAETPEPLTQKEIKLIINDFKQATIRAMKTGFDGIELHGANTYLIQQFFSPHSNRRTDRYGGSKEKRITFIKELIEACLEAKEEQNNDTFIIGYRFSPEEHETPGITLEDTEYLLEEISQYPLDYIHISLSQYDQSSVRDEEDNRAIAKVLLPHIHNNIPFIGVGNITTPTDIKNALDLGYELLAVGKIALANTNVIDQLKNGKTPPKVISKESKLPEPLYKKLKKNMSGQDSEYTVK